MVRIERARRVRGDMVSPWECVRDWCPRALQVFRRTWTFILSALGTIRRFWVKKQNDLSCVLKDHSAVLRMYLDRVRKGQETSQNAIATNYPSERWWWLAPGCWQWRCWEVRGSAYILTMKSTSITDRLELGLKRSWKQGYRLSPLGFHRPGGLYNEGLFLPILGSPRSRCRQIQCLQRACVPVPRQPAGARKLSGDGSTSWPSHLPEPTHPDPSHWGLGFTMNFGKIQTFSLLQLPCSISGSTLPCFNVMFFSFSLFLNPDLLDESWAFKISENHFCPPELFFSALSLSS